METPTSNRAKSLIAFAVTGFYTPSMFQRVITHLLLLVIVVCPFNCMSGLGCHLSPDKVNESAASASDSKCPCCDLPSSCDGNQSLNELPVEDLPSSGCANCICHGAIISSGLNDVEIELHTSSYDCVFAADFFLLEARLGSPSVFKTGFRNAPVFHSGRFVRISLQSLTI